MTAYANLCLSHVPPCAPGSCASNSFQAGFEWFSYLIVFATGSNEFKVITAAKIKEEKHVLFSPKAAMP